MVLVAAQVVLASSSCVSVRTTGSRELAGGGGGVGVTVFPDDAARRGGRPGPPAILGELDRREGRDWVPVFRSLDPAWTVAGLAPGSYRLRFPARLDDAGNVVRLDTKPLEVRVREGRLTETRAVLRHVDTALVVAGVVTVVVAVVLLARYLEHHDLPEPPPPPPGLVETVFWVTLDASGEPAWQGAGDRQPPQATSHFPASGALVAARRPRVVLAMSEPLRASSVAGNAVTVLGERSGLVGGVVSCDADHWWVVWEPQEDLAPGDTWHVTLAAGAVEDLSGNDLESPVSFSFATAR